MKNMWLCLYKLTLQSIKSIVNSGDLKSHHLKSRFLKVGFQMIWFSKCFWQNGSHLSGFKMVGLQNFRSHLKPTSIGPFKIQTRPDFRSPLYTQGLCYGTLRVEFTCTGHCPNRCMSWRGSFVTSSFGFRCGGGEEALELEGVMSPEARSLCEGLEARLMSSDSAVLGHSCQPLPANSRSWDMLLLPILPKGRPVNND